MLDFLKNWMVNIIILVMFIVLVEMLVPSGKMKKYISLVTGIILVIAIINPFLKLFGSKYDLEDIQTSNSNYIDKVEIEKNSKLLKEKQMKQIIEVYRKKLIKQIEQSTNDIKGVVSVNADVIINEDYTSEKFGEIKRAYLVIAMGNANKGIKPVTKIDDVKVGSGKSTSTKADKIEPQIKKQLEDKISSLFNLEKENIIISQQ